MTLKHLLPPNIYEVIDRAGISTAKQITILSVWDIMKSTNIKSEDILLLKKIVTDHVCPISVTGKDLKRIDSNLSRICTGCSAIDNQLKGGLRRGTITEIFGESGSGKTQLALQITLKNWASGCIYICTEDLFPTKRFEEIKKSLPQFDPKIDYGKNVLVEHLTEAKDLLSCIRVRLPKVLAQNNLSLIVIDSVAAPFRCESTNYVKRAEDLRELAISLTTVAQEYNLVILCINQVTTSFEDLDNVLPSLGLAWSNMVTTRIMIKKTMKIAVLEHSHQLLSCKHDIYVRELITVFAPELPNTMTEFVITSNGIQSISD